MTREHARVSRYRFRNAKNAKKEDIANFKKLCESGFITKSEAKEIANKHKIMLDDVKKELSQIVANMEG